MYGVVSLGKEVHVCWVYVALHVCMHDGVGLSWCAYAMVYALVAGVNVLCPLKLSFLPARPS